MKGEMGVLQKASTPVTSYSRNFTAANLLIRHNYSPLTAFSNIVSRSHRF